MSHMVSHISSRTNTYILRVGAAPVAADRVPALTMFLCEHLSSQLQDPSRPIGVTGKGSNTKVQVTMSTDNPHFAELSRALTHAGHFAMPWDSDIVSIPTSLTTPILPFHHTTLLFRNIPAECAVVGLPCAVLSLAGYSILPPAPIDSAPPHPTPGSQAVSILRFRQGHQPNGLPDPQTLVIDLLPPPDDPHLRLLPSFLALPSPHGAPHAHMDTFVYRDPLRTVPNPLSTPPLPSTIPPPLSADIEATSGSTGPQPALAPAAAPGDAATPQHTAAAYGTAALHGATTAAATAGPQPALAPVPGDAATPQHTAAAIGTAAIHGAPAAAATAASAATAGPQPALPPVPGDAATPQHTAAAIGTAAIHGAPAAAATAASAATAGPQPALPPVPGDAATPQHTAAAIDTAAILSSAAAAAATAAVAWATAAATAATARASAAAAIPQHIAAAISTATIHGAATAAGNPTSSILAAEARAALHRPASSDEGPLPCHLPPSLSGWRESTLVDDDDDDDDDGDSQHDPGGHTIAFGGATVKPVSVGHTEGDLRGRGLPFQAGPSSASVSRATRAASRAAREAAR